MAKPPTLIDQVKKAASNHPNRDALAKQAGFSGAQLSRFISGKSKITAEKLIALMTIFELKPHQVLDVRKAPPPTPAPKLPGPMRAPVFIDSGEKETSSLGRALAAREHLDQLEQGLADSPELRLRAQVLIEALDAIIFRLNKKPPRPLRGLVLREKKS